MPVVSTPLAKNSLALMKSRSCFSKKKDEVKIAQKQAIMT